MVENHCAGAYPAHAIAIIGFSGRFPGAQNLDEFWRDIQAGRETIETFSDVDLEEAGVSEAVRTDPSYVRRGTVLHGAELFDAAFFGIAPREAQILDPQHRVFLECAWEALEHAGHASDDHRQSIGVYGGASMNTYLIAHILRHPALIEAVGGYQLMLGNDKDFLCTRVSYKLNLRGPSMTLQTACSTSLVAVEAACRALQSGECDMALAGGVSLSFPQRSGYLYQTGMILSPDGRCRPFDVDAAGTRGGAGAGIVVLKRLADALADRDTIHAVIRGAAINNDGAAKAGYTAPSVDGQAEVISMAHALAEVDPRSISYIEAHGTATPLGDPIEIAALTKVFRASTPDVGFCRLGSLKANLGHLDAAAGVAGLIKTILALSHRELPPLANFRAPNPQLELEHSPFCASAQGGPWPSGATPRRAGVSSFGIGGTNAHVVVEEPPPVNPTVAARKDVLLVLSARTATALDQATANLADCIEANDSLALSDIAWTLQVGRKSFGHRRIVVARDRAQAVRLLRQHKQAPVLTALHEGGERPVAFLFSGQGSQYPGMGAELYRSEPVYRDAIDRCAELLQPHLGLDIRDLLYGDSGRHLLDQTRVTQPALFCTEYALASLWMHWGIFPKAMVGHSIGEYVAAHLAGVMSLEDALKVVATRGRLLQALPPGAMAAIYLSAAELKPRLTSGVEIAAVNGPGLCTISGPSEKLAELLRKLEASGIESRALHTSHAFHSSMMDPALEPFESLLSTIALAPPKIPYVSNVTGTWITSEQATSPAYYAAHLRQAVLFDAAIRTLVAEQAHFLLEVGPGNVLTTLVRGILGSEIARHAASSLANPRRADLDSKSMLEAAGRLWLAGVPVAWSDMVAGDLPQRVPLPTYPFERTLHTVDRTPGRPMHAAADRERTQTVPPAATIQRLYAPSWTRDETTVAKAPRVLGVWIVFADPSPLAEATVDQLQAAGAATIFAETGAAYERLDQGHFRLRPGDPDDIGALLQEVDRAHGSVAGAIMLWDLAAADAAWVSAPTRGYTALVALAAGVEAHGGGGPISVIAASAGVQSVLDEAVVRPDAALLFGPVMVLPTEVPGMRIRSVDFQLGDATPDVAAMARMLVVEAASGAAENFSAWRKGRRWLRRFQQVTLPEADATVLPLKKGGSYLITGGLGGIGLALATWLAQTASARVLLTSRRPLPPREAWDALLTGPVADEKIAIIRAIRHIEAIGGTVMTAVADAADAAAMGAAIDNARECWGDLDGVIHAAGVPGNGSIAILEDDQETRSVLSPKVDGLRVLMQLLGQVQLDFVALMSSISSVIGNAGGCAYAAANAVFDSFIDSTARPFPWKQVVAINWAAWRDVGMAANVVVPERLREGRKAFLLTGIATDAGVDAFARILGSSSRRIVMTSDDLEALGRGEGGKPAVSAPPRDRVAPARSDTLAPLMVGDPADARDPPVTDTEKCLAAIWTELTGISNIGVHDDFFELGGHSLLATRVLARVGAVLGVRLSLRDVFDAPTIRQLAERIGAAAHSQSAVEDLASDEREEILI